MLLVSPITIALVDTILTKFNFSNIISFNSLIPSKIQKQSLVSETDNKEMLALFNVALASFCFVCYLWKPLNYINKINGYCRNCSLTHTVAFIELICWLELRNIQMLIHYVYVCVCDRVFLLHPTLCVKFPLVFNPQSVKILTYREPQNPEYKDFVSRLKADAMDMFNFTVEDSLVIIPAHLHSL